MKLKAGLVSLAMLAILISCNNYIKPEDPKIAINKLNDTSLFVQTSNFSRYAKEAAQYAREKSSNKDFKMELLKIESFQENSKNKVDSLLHIKGIAVPEEMSKDLQNSLQQIKNKKDALVEQEFIDQLENRLVNEIDYLEAFSKRSENNESTTLAILLLSGMQEQLELLMDLRQKLATQ